MPRRVGTKNVSFFDHLHIDGLKNVDTFVRWLGTKAIQDETQKNKRLQKRPSEMHPTYSKDSLDFETFFAQWPCRRRFRAKNVAFVFEQVARCLKK
jgi:hypothetical protein